MSTSKLAAARKAAEDALITLRDLAAVHQRFAAEPNLGSVIQFTKRYTAGGKGYSFAALRAGAGWYITGARSSSSAGAGNRMTFEALVEFIGDSKAWVSGDWIEVPTLNPEVPAENNEELLARVTDLLNQSSGKDLNEVAKTLLEIVTSAGESSEGAGDARFRGGRVYDDRA